MQTYTHTYAVPWDINLCGKIDFGAIMSPYIHTYIHTCAVPWDTNLCGEIDFRAIMSSSQNESDHLDHPEHIKRKLLYALEVPCHECEASVPPSNDCDDDDVDQA